MSNLHLLNNKSQKNNSKGFYIALGVCLIAVGVAAWTTYDSVVNYAAPDEGATSSAQVQHTNETVSGIKVFAGDETSSAAEPAQSEPAKEEPSQAPSAPPAPPSSAIPAKQTTASVLTFTSPVEKSVALKFSGENPVFSTTMKDWRVHNGTDFSAKAGTAVKAVANGTVKNVYTDDLYGVTAVILHGDYETYYCGLDAAVSVKKGAAVKQGQQIGSVGTVPCESADASHLHLSMKKAGKYVDPLSVIK